MQKRCTIGNSELARAKLLEEFVPILSVLASCRRQVEQAAEVALPPEEKDIEIVDPAADDVAGTNQLAETANEGGEDAALAQEPPPEQSQSEKPKVTPPS